MQNGQFTNRIMDYLGNSGKTLNEALLAEGGARVQEAFKRQLMEDRQDQKGILRMSGSGICARKQWYNYNGVKGEPLSGRTVNTFLTGDILEVSASIIARLAGWQLLGKDQKEDVLTVDIPRNGGRGEPDQEPYKVTGRIDDLLFIPEENKYYLVEFKSASSYSFDEFEKNGLSDDWGYKSQVSMYLHALGLEQAIVVYIKKETGHIADHVVTKDMNLVSQAMDNWRRIVNDPSAPDRKFSPVDEQKYNRSKKLYEPTGRSVLPIQCQYCQFCKSDCWPDANVEIKSGKPVFVVGQSVDMDI